MVYVLQGINQISLTDKCTFGSTKLELFVLLDLVSKLTNDVREFNMKLEDLSKQKRKTSGK